MSDGNEDEPSGLLPAKRAKGDKAGERSSWSKVEAIDWSLCLFSQKVKHKCHEF